MRKVLFVLVVLCSALVANAQDITGTWSGRLETPNGGLTVVFHINATDDGYSGKLDSPDQNAYGIDLTSVTYKDSEIVIKMVNLGAVYEGKLENKDEMKGTFTQAGQVLALLLKRKKE